MGFTTHSVIKLIWYIVGVLIVGFTTHSVIKLIWYNVGVLTVGVYDSFSNKVNMVQCRGFDCGGLRLIRS